MRKIWKIFFSRVFVLSLLIIVQLLFMMAVFSILSYSFKTVEVLFRILSFIIIIYIINRNDNPSYKLVWCIMILVIPLFGGIIYLMFGGKKVPKELRLNILKSHEESSEYIEPHRKIIKEINEFDLSIGQQFNYVQKCAGWPVYKNTNVNFFKLGEEKFAQLITELNNAKSFIYLEYFIIAEGRMWNTILNILKNKVKEGVDVRLIYDDAGCFSTLDKNFSNKIRDLGIKCEVFNPLRPQLVIQMNNRDHRKLVIIDNEVAFTGGINLADEYINELDRFGHWKDTAVMLKGEAVLNCTIMFVQVWNFLSNDKIDYEQIKEPKLAITDGYVLPFSDSPTDEENVGLTVHMNLINNAKHSIYIQTPYLIINDELHQALSNAAKLGKDVRIIVPHIPDKWYAHMMTRGNYYYLVKNGVKVYEYLPGFIHSKTFLCDDEVGLCGTINMDYRSYYMHYEDGVLMYKSSALSRMKEDFIQTLDVSQLITEEDCNNVHWTKKLLYAIFNLFSPLL